jgi:hypothetical protein
VFDITVLFGEFLVYVVTHKTPPRAERRLAAICAWTDGRFNDVASWFLSMWRHNRSTKFAVGILGALDTTRQADVRRRLDRDGFLIFQERLAPGLCDRLVHFARTTPAMLEPSPATGPRAARYDPAQPLAPRYQFTQAQLLADTGISAIASDPTILAVAHTHLRVPPILNVVTMWWSPVFGPGPSSEAAQLFHFDLDGLRFIKFFFYLTDVDCRRGPHMYVKGSHGRKPASLHLGGRVSDSTIYDHYGSDAVASIVGERGTIFAALTRGFHKGQQPLSGDRLVLQLEYVNTMFAAASPE